MKTKLVTAPAAEPVLLAAAKEHMRIESAYVAEDAYITTLLTAARKQVENILNRKLITQTWKLYLNDWPDNKDYIELPFGKLQSVTSVVYIDSDQTSNTWSSSYYIVESDTEPARIVLRYLESWPTATLSPSNPIQIQFICGYGLTGATVDDDIILAIKMTIADMYANREGFVVGRSYIPTNAVTNLLSTHRLWSFG